MENNTSNILIATAIGIVAGSITGILLAPASGKETRKKIKKRAKKLKKRFSSGLDDLKENGKEVLEKVK